MHWANQLRRSSPRQGVRNWTLTIAGLVFVVALVGRVVAFNFIWPNSVREVVALNASAALGLDAGKGLTVNYEEISHIYSLGLEGRNWDRIYYEDAPRLPLWEVEPGLSLILAAVWKLTGFYDLRPLVWLQIVLDSILCVTLFLALKRVSGFVASATALSWALFPPQIQFACTAGYDIWASFSLVAVCSGMVFLSTRQLSWRIEILAMLGMSLISVVGLWTRSYVLLWPFLTLMILFFIVRAKQWRPMLLMAYAIPVIVGIMGLMFLRESLVGSPRPTRTTVWHVFWTGVGQYDNPYNLEDLDQSIYTFAQSLDPRLKEWFEKGKYEDMWTNPVFNLHYDMVLGNQAKLFIKEHIGMVVRNYALRSLRLIVPTIRMAESTSAAIGVPRIVLAITGILMVPLYVLGARWWYKRADTISLIAFLSPVIYFLMFLVPVYIDRRFITLVIFVHVSLIVCGGVAAFEFLRAKYSRLFCYC